MDIPESVLDWLLEEDDPCARYRTLTELLGKDRRSSAVRDAQARIPESSHVQRVFSAMTPDGIWLYHKGAPDGIRQCAGIGCALSELAELGISVADARVASAVERFLGYQAEDGDFFKQESCYYSLFLYSLTRLGCASDPRVRKTADLLCRSGRHDGGYLCDRKHRGRNLSSPMRKSCIRGSAKALLAFAELPELWSAPACEALARYFLDRHVLFERQNHHRIVLPELAQPRLPFSAYGGLLETVYALSKLGHGRDPRMDAAWERLERHRMDDGRYRLQRSWYRSVLGWEKDQPNKFVTLYAYLARKLRDASP